MLFRIDFKAGRPPYLQIIDQVKYAVASGRLRLGEPIQSIRPLAEQLRLNRNTVAKAYEELERQGIIKTIAGKGSFIASPPSPYSKSARHQLLQNKIDAACVTAHHLQIDAETFLQLTRERLAFFEREIDKERTAANRPPTKTEDKYEHSATSH